MREKNTAAFVRAPEAKDHINVTWGLRTLYSLHKRRTELKCTYRSRGEPLLQLIKTFLESNTRLKGSGGCHWPVGRPGGPPLGITGRARVMDGCEGDGDAAGFLYF